MLKKILMGLLLSGISGAAWADLPPTFRCVSAAQESLQWYQGMGRLVVTSSDGAARIYENLALGRTVTVTTEPAQVETPILDRRFQPAKTVAVLVQSKDTRYADAPVITQIEFEDVLFACE
jgi:hypothetical protein